MPAAPAPFALVYPIATSLDRSEDSTLSALYRAAIGPVNPGYYLPVFERFESAGRVGSSWNRAACLCTLNWMAFRQLWGAALVYLGALAGVALLVLGLDRLLFHFSETTQWCLLAAFATVAFVAPGVWGNAILHTHLRKTMASALAATATVPEACVLLNRRASSRQRMVWLALLNAVVAGAAIGTWIAWPDASRRASGASPALAPVPVAAPARKPVMPVSAPLPAPLASLAAIAASAAAPVAQASAAFAFRPGPPASIAAPAASASAPQVAASKPKAPASATTTSNTTTTIATSKATAADKRFYINVGLFAQDSNAQKAHATLLEAGLASFTQELDGPKGKRTRVRVGPFGTQQEADAAAEKIRALKLDAVVFRQ